MSADYSSLQSLPPATMLQVQTMRVMQPEENAGLTVTPGLYCEVGTCPQFRLYSVYSVYSVVVTSVATTPCTQLLGTTQLW